MNETRRTAASNPNLASVRGGPIALAPATVLSNGRYRVLVTANGGGFSALGDVWLTRWHADAAGQHDGLRLWLRDREDASCWPAGFGTGASGFDTAIGARSPGVLRTNQVAHEIDSTLEVCVPPEDDCELRRITLRNRSSRTRTIDVTTFCELALMPFEADLSHPAFSRLFVQTELHAPSAALLAVRRRWVRWPTWRPTESSFGWPCRWCP